MAEIARILKSEPECQVEFPVKPGLRNRVRAPNRAAEEDDHDSWCVRYYSIKELKALFMDRFGNLSRGTTAA